MQIQLDEEGLVRLLARRVEEFRLSAHSHACLASVRITHLIELVQWSEEEMLFIPGFTTKSLGEVRRRIHSLGLVFGMRPNYRPNKEEDDLLWPTGEVAIVKYRPKLKALGFE